MERFFEILDKHERVGLYGAPNSGKTTLSKLVEDRKVLHTDDWMPMEFKSMAEKISKEAPKEGPLLIEGVAVPRAAKHGLPLDAIVVLEGTHKPNTPRQAAMDKGQRTILKTLKTKTYSL